MLAILSVFTAGVISVPLPPKSNDDKSAAPVEHERDRRRVQRYGAIGLQPQKVVRYQPVDCVHPDSAPYLPRQVLESSGLIPGNMAQAAQGGMTAGGEMVSPNAMTGGVATSGDASAAAGGAMGSAMTQLAPGTETTIGGVSSTTDGSAAVMNADGQSGVEGGAVAGASTNNIGVPGGVTLGSVAPGGVASGGVASGGVAPVGVAPGGDASGGVVSGGVAPSAQVAWNGAPQTGATDAATAAGAPAAAAENGLAVAPGAAAENAVATQSTQSTQSTQVTSGIEQTMPAGTTGETAAQANMAGPVSATNVAATMTTPSAGGGAEAPAGDAVAMTGGGVASGAAGGVTGVAPVVSADLGQSNGLFAASTTATTGVTGAL
ncbi:hypothetical protein FGB62_93g026 [Gracilaria domingensis]|nr:hypothetical protein FGB62_93g026 [Gracilaria domingensis]